MTNYNERLDELLGTMLKANNLHILPFDKNIAQAKAALTSLIKELVVEARIDELKHLTDDDGIWYQDMARQFPQKITINQRIKELEVWTN